MDRLQLTLLQTFFLLVMSVGLLSAQSHPSPDDLWPPPDLHVVGTTTLTAYKDSGRSESRKVRFEHYAKDGAVLSRASSPTGELGLLYFPDHGANASWRIGDPNLGPDHAMYTSGSPGFDLITVFPLHYLARYKSELDKVERGHASIVIDSDGLLSIQEKPELLNEGSPHEHIKTITTDVAYEGSLVKSILPVQMNETPTGEVHVFSLGEILTEGNVAGFPFLAEKVVTKSYRFHEGQPRLQFTGEATLQSVEHLVTEKTLQAFAQELFEGMELMTPESNLSAFGVDVQEIGTPNGTTVARAERASQARGWFSGTRLTIIIAGLVAVSFVGFFLFFLRSFKKP